MRNLWRRRRKNGVPEPQPVAAELPHVLPEIQRLSVVPITHESPVKVVPITHESPVKVVPITHESPVKVSTVTFAGQVWRALAVDGGGVRGIGALLMLKHIMSTMGNKHPWECFDIICGTSTGGLIAIMLGRLKMSIQDCIDAYEELAEKIFGKEGQKTYTWPLPYSSSRPRYCQDNFKRVLRKFIEEKTNNPDEPMLVNNDNNGHQCKVFVVAVNARKTNHRKPVLFRTYNSVSEKVDAAVANAKIWEACLATAAAPTYFPPVKIGEVKHLDGGLGFNNPIHLLYMECRLLFGGAKPHCVLSFGNGVDPPVHLEKTFTVRSVLTGAAFKNLVSMTTNTQQAHLIYGQLVEGAPGCYFRFNVGEKLCDAGQVPDRNSGSEMDPRRSGSFQQQTPVSAKENRKTRIKFDDYKNMKKHGMLCDDYIRQPEMKDRVEQCRERLKPVDLRNHNTGEGRANINVRPLPAVPQGTHAHPQSRVMTDEPGFRQGPRVPRSW